MKRSVFIFLITFVILGPAAYSQNSSKIVEIPALPRVMDEFIGVRNDLSTTPEGGAAVLVLALYLYTQDKEFGLDALTLALDRSVIIEKSDGYKGYAPSGSFLSYLTTYLDPRPYLAPSYLLGTSPENGYTVPPGPLRVEVFRNAYSKQPNGDMRVLVECSGADSPRPVTLSENNRGIWKAVNTNSLFVGIRKPVEVIDDEL